MAVNYKIGADASAFNKGVNEAQANLKTLDAALKVNENSFKVAGDAQIYMSQKTQLLTDKLTKQKQLVQQLQNGLRQMRENGVAPTSVEYQKLERDMLNAQNAMLETQKAIDGLDESQQKGAKSAGELTTAVNSIGKKISLDQVISGINSITTTMEKATGKAVQLGETIWDNVMNSAKWADDAATMALMYDIPLEKYLQMQQLVQNGMDTSVEAILKSQTKLNKNIGDGNKSTLEAMRDLGVTLSYVTGEAMDIVHRNDPADVFWELGDALMHAEKGFDRESAAQAIFGRSWKELVPLFTEFKNQGEFDEALSKVHTNTEKEVNDLATLYDKVGELQGNITTLTNKGWAALATPLTGAAEALNGVLSNVLEYLEKPEGQQALKDMETAVSGLFEDLGEIDPDQVVSGFTKVFDSVISGLKWLVNNKDGIGRALKDVVFAWGGLKLTGGALQVWQLINGLRGLTSGTGGGDGGGTTATTAGTGTFFGDMFKSGTGAFASGVANFLTSGRGIIGISTLLGIPMFDKIVHTDWPETFNQMWKDLTNVRAVTDVIGNSPEQNVNAFRAATGALFGFEPSKKKAGQDLISVVEDVVHEALGISGGGGSHGFGGWKKQAGGDLLTEAIENWAERQPITATPAGQTMTLLDLFWPRKNRVNGEEGVPISVVPDAPEDSAEKIAAQVGPVEIPAILMVTSDHSNAWTKLGSFGAGGRSQAYYLKDLFGLHANGLWSVPFDDYPALLHRGERVVPAREVSSQSYNSNLYVEKMIMNNGADAQGLADAIAARQRRQARGYGG